MRTKVSSILNLLLVTATVGMAGLIHAADFYVSSQGNDQADGTKADPWRTIQHAATVLKPGDTAHVQAGTYHEKIEIQAQGSKAGGFVTFQAEGRVILSGKGADGDNMWHVKDRSYIRIIGFEITEHTGVKDGSGIRLEGSGSHLELKQNVIHGIRGKDAMGITVYGSNSEVPLSNIVIEGNTIADCEPARSEAMTLNGNVTDFQIVNNVVKDVNNIGICMIGGESWLSKDPNKVTRNGICKGNKVMRARSNYEDGYAAGIYVDGGRDIVVENNEVTGCNLGIEVGAENKGIVARNVIVRHNVIWHNQKGGLVFGGYEKNAGRVSECTFTGNICYQNDRSEDVNGELWIQWASDNVVTGNVFWAGDEAMMLQADTAGTKNTLKDNVYYTASGEEEANFTWKGHDVTGFETFRQQTGQEQGSRFAKPTFRNPDNGDFR